MEVYRVILADEANFLRSTFQRLLAKTEAVEVVAEVEGAAEIATVLDQIEADWLLLSLNEEGELPEEVRAELEHHPDLRVLALNRNSSEMRIQWVERWDRETDNFSVAEFIEILTTPKEAQPQERLREYPRKRGLSESQAG